MDAVFEANFGNGFVNIGPPLNWKTDTKSEVAFTSDTPSAAIQNGNFIWLGDVAARINIYIAQGMTGGTGIGEGIPIQISVNNSNPVIYIFQGVIDIANQGALFEIDKVQAPLKRIGSIDWLDTLFEGITYTLLEQTACPDFTTYIGTPGSGAKYIYKKVPYVVTQETDVPQALMLILEGISEVQQIYQALKTTLNEIALIVGDIASVPFDIPAIAIDFASLVIDIGYDVILSIALVGLIETILNNLGIITSWKYAMTATDLIMVAIDYVNNQGGNPSIKFSSTIFGVNAAAGYNGVYATTPTQAVTLMPKKPIKENASLEQSFFQGGVAAKGNELDAPNTYGYYDDNVKQYFKDIGGTFNAKLFVFTVGSGISINFEEIHHYYNIANFNVPNTEKPGFNLNLPSPFAYNWPELNWDYELIFRIDEQEERTTIVYTGTSCAVVTQPIIVDNTLNLLPPRSKSVQLPFALAKRKEYPNVVEKVAFWLANAVEDVWKLLIDGINAVIGAINSVISTFGGNPNAIKKLTPPIPLSAQGFVGYLEVSSNSWNVPKIFIGVSGTDYNNAPCWKVAPNNGANNNGIWVNPNSGYGLSDRTHYVGEGDMSAWALMNLFHSLNLPLFTPVDRNGNKQPTIHNQWLIFKGKRFPLGPTDFLNILNYNVLNVQIKSPVTNELITVFGKFDKILWDLYHEVVETADYRVSYQYTENLYTSITIDGN